jgi:hypothetical protein
VKVGKQKTGEDTEEQKESKGGKGGGIFTKPLIMMQLGRAIDAPQSWHISHNHEQNHLNVVVGNHFLSISIVTGLIM